MGTTADKLQKVLDSKNAIRDKFKLADNLPFSQYADNISSGADVILGVVDAQGNFQPFEFQGIEATNSGYPEGVSVYYTWDSTLPAPDMSIGDLSFITATAEDILAGKIGADTEGNPVEGLLVKGTDVSDTTATASDVLTGKQFYDAEGTLTQGTLVPSGTGGSADYYKCAEVGLPETSSLPVNTWTGYKAYLVEDTENNKTYYDFETTLTTDTLTWGNGFTPEVDGVYDAAAMVRVELTLPDTTWRDLSARVQAGEFTEANLGDIIEVPNTALTDIGLLEGVIQFQIVAIDNADLVNETTHSITLMAKNCLYKSVWDSTKTDWESSTLRDSLQNKFIQCLPEAFVQHIASVNRVHYSPVTDNAKTSVDTIFVPSFTEMGGEANNGVMEGVHFGYMTEDGRRAKDSLGESYYWLSSWSVNANDDYAKCVNGGWGWIGEIYCDDSYAVAPTLVFV